MQAQRGKHHIIESKASRLLTTLMNHRWTILPVTIRRKPSTLAGDRGVKNDGDFDISEEIQQKIKPTHHQFYGAWRAMTINDNLDKWIGYKDTSLQMSSGNEYQDTKD